MNGETEKEKEVGGGVLEFLEAHGLNIDCKIDEKMNHIPFEIKAKIINRNF